MTDAQRREGTTSTVWAPAIMCLLRDSYRNYTNEVAQNELALAWAGPLLRARRAGSPNESPKQVTDRLTISLATLVPIAVIGRAAGDCRIAHVVKLAGRDERLSARICGGAIGHEQLYRPQLSASSFQTPFVRAPREPITQPVRSRPMLPFRPRAESPRRCCHS